MIDIERRTLEGRTFIDLFAGLGGFRLALESLGARCVYSSEWDRDAQRVYADNFGEAPDGDITKVDERSIPDHDVLCGGFPCQAFSVSGKRRGFEDSRGTLFFDVARIVREKRPKAVFLENVKNFATHDGGRTLAVVNGTMEELGYSFNARVLNAADYGVPQIRERIYIVCFRNDLGVTGFGYPDKVPLERHVEDLLLDDPEAVAHLYTKRTDIRMNGRRDVLSSRPIQLGIVNKGGQGERIYGVKGAGITLSAYGGAVFAKTGGYMVGGRPRRLHPRECARMMGFPDSYRMDPKPSHAYKQFGNSVVVDVLQRIASNIGDALSGADYDGLFQPPLF